MPQTIELGGEDAGAAYLVFGLADTVAVETGGLTGSDGFALNGEEAGDSSGYSVSDAGDVNGDGFADVIIGAPDADPHGDYSGAAYVVFGGAGGFAGSVELGLLDGTAGFILNGAAEGDYAGYVVSGAGDVNGDGFDDLLIGAYGADVNGVYDVGKAYVVFGGAGVGIGSPVELSALDDSDGFVIHGVAESDYTGNAVSGAGDVNGDGFDDLLIGAAEADVNGVSDVGSTYLLFGGAGVGNGGTIELSALNSSDGFRLDGAAADDEAGYAVSGAGDVNGDGFADLLIGTPEADPNGDRSGAAYVVFGGASVGSSGPVALGSLSGSDGFHLEGAAAEDYAGHAVSGAGDVNGDGFADLLVGAPGVELNGPASGAAYVVFGGATVGNGGSINLGSLDGSDGFVLNGVAAYDEAGHAVSDAGDVNGDGFDDLLIGAYGVDAGASEFEYGAAYVVFGGANAGSSGSVELGTLDASEGFVLRGAAEYDFAGYAVSGAGDVNGDGFADLLVGAYGADNTNGDKAGTSYVLFGSPLNHPILPGGPGANTLRSTGEPQQLFGAQGADSLFGNAGDDLLDGGAGDDLLDRRPGRRPAARRLRQRYVRVRR